MPALSQLSPNDTGFPHLAKSLIDLRRDLKCPVCLDDLCSAQTLPCGHVLCKECALGVLKQSIGDCPLCKRKYTKRGLRPNDTYNTVVMAYHRLSAAVNGEILSVEAASRMKAVETTTFEEVLASYQEKRKSKKEWETRLLKKQRTEAERGDVSNPCTLSTQRMTASHALSPLSAKSEGSRGSNKGQSANRCVLCPQTEVPVDGCSKLRSLVNIPKKEMKEINSMGRGQKMHRICALWAPEVYQNESNEFVNVLRAVKRGRRLKCPVCKTSGATVGCCVKSCRRSYHYVCLKPAGCVASEDTYSVFCPEHAGEVNKDNSSSQSGSFSERNEEVSKSHSSKPAPSRENLEPRPEEAKRSSRVAASSTNQILNGRSWRRHQVLAVGLSQEQKKRLVKALGRLGGTLASSFSRQVTHVVTSTNQKGIAPLSIPYCLGLVSGRWVVTWEWVLVSLETGRWMSEEPFEVIGDTVAQGGAAKGRLRAAKGAPGLFEEYVFYFVDIIASQNVEQVVRFGSGYVYERPPLVADRDGRDFIVVLPDSAREEDYVSTLASLPEHTVVHDKWILECVGRQSVDLEGSC